MAAENQEPQQTEGSHQDGDHHSHARSSSDSSNSSGSHHGPPGGFDSTPIPPAPPGYTLRFTFHRALNLPLGDVSTLSSDPYILAILGTDLPQRHRQDPPLTFRSPTLRRTANPEWECSWTVANVPASGFRLKCRVYDADSADHDDRLGSAYVDVDQISEDWAGLREQEFKIRKRMGSLRAYFLRFVVSSLSKEGRAHHGFLVLSVECLGRTPGEDGGQIYTVGPNYWRQHFSPLIGRLVGVKDSITQSKDGQHSISRYNFQAIQMQLKGPVPPQLYHRYVEFRPFVKGMFNAQTVRGRLLNHALHHQHARIYNYDRGTEYGEFPEPQTDLTKKFLDFVQHDRGGRIYTYVITLDGQWRFTETGREFGIDLLSKHTMHSNVAIYIAFSGEFFVRRKGHDYRRHRHHHHHHSSSRPQSKRQQQQQRLQAEDAGADQAGSSDHGNLRGEPSPSSLTAPGHGHGEAAGSSSRPRSSHSHRSLVYDEPTTDANPPPEDPSIYELFIDNDSGTYRPNAVLLPQLHDFLAANLPGLKITTLDSQGEADRMNELKTDQRERKKEASAGRSMAFIQRRRSSSSLSSAASAPAAGGGTGPGPGAAADPDGSLISSSEEEELDRRAGDVRPRHARRAKAKRAVDVKARFRAWLEGSGPKDHQRSEGPVGNNGRPWSEGHAQMLRREAGLSQDGEKVKKNGAAGNANANANEESVRAVR